MEKNTMEQGDTNNMDEHRERPVPADEGVYELPRTADDMKRELAEGTVSLLSGLIWFIVTGVVLGGLWLMFERGTLISESTEYSRVLSLIVFLPVLGVIFNIAAPHRGLFFIRLNSLVYTILPFALCMLLLFGYSKVRDADGFVIYTDQLGNELIIRGDGTHEPIIGENEDPWNYELRDGRYMIEVDGELEPVRATVVKDYYYERGTARMQFEELRKWVVMTDRPATEVGESEYTIAKFEYHLGVDGISFPLIILTTLLSTLAIISSFNITRRLKEYMSWFLLLEVGMLGTFVALDYLLFYIFWELVLVPMYFLIAIWGGPRKEYAALKFFLYTLFGSVFLLVGIISLYFLTGRQTFDIIKLQDLAPTYLSSASMFRWQLLLFGAFFLSFAIKVPIFPFHTWLPDAHVEAPTAISVLLAGVLLKMGTYGFMRMSVPTFPEAAYCLAPALGVLAVINILYGSLVAMAQTDLKKLVAYSSIGHMGFAMLGIAALNKWGMNAAQLQIFNHGIISASLFLLVGVIYDRAHTRDLNVFGGLLPQMRMYGIIMIIASMANLGLPGLAGFWGEFLSLMGAVNQTDFITSGGLAFFRVLAPIAVIGIIITAGYMLIMVKKIFMGPLNERWSWLWDMDARELVATVPLILLMIFIGVYPMPLIALFDQSIARLVDLARLGAGVPPVGF